MLNQIATAALAAMILASTSTADGPRNQWGGLLGDEQLALELAEILKERADYSETGEASLFWQPQALACGGRPLSYKTNGELWAAHPALPCWQRVKVISLDNGKEVVVTIVDRGPDVEGRIIDLTLGAGARIGLTRKVGVMPVRIEWIPNDIPSRQRRRKRR